jgi:hypothetical protein
MPTEDYIEPAPVVVAPVPPQPPPEAAAPPDRTAAMVAATEPLEPPQEPGSAHPLCVVCEQPADPDELDSEMWEQVNTVGGWLWALLRQRTPVEAGRRLFEGAQFCRSCGLIAHRCERTFRQSEVAADEEYQLAKAARRQRWDREGLVRRVKQVRDDELERDGIEQKDLDRRRTRARARMGELSAAAEWRSEWP